MKVRVEYTVEVNDEFRRAIRRYYGDSGLASRADVRRWCQTYGDSMDADVMYDYGDEEEWVDAKGRPADVRRA